MKNSVSNSSSILANKWLVWTAATLVIGIVAISGVDLLRPSSSPQHTKILSVVAAENFWGDIASQIGGSHVNVTSIITDPSADPHQYESNAHDGLAVAQSSVMITNGLGYDDAISKLLSSSPKADRTLLVAANVLGAKTGDNPHLWYDTPRLPQVARAIEAAFAAKDPADRADFERNLQTFETSLAPLNAIIAQIRAQYSASSVAYTERVPGYLLADAGLSVVSPAGFAQAIEDGNDPSPADTAAMNNLLASRAVRVLLYNAQATSPTTVAVRATANEAGVAVIGVTETIPAGAKNFQAWQLSQDQALLKALAK